MDMPEGIVDRFKFCFGLAGKFNYVTEELPDYFIHRRFAQVVVGSIGALNLPNVFTPNRITLLSLMSGLYASYLFRSAVYNDEKVLFLYAAAWELASIVLDCCDGQLARLYGTGSIVGRVLDGTADMIVALSFAYSYYEVLVFAGVLTHSQSFVWVGLGATCYQQQAMLFDRVKALYIAKSSPVKGKVVGLEEAAQIESDLKEAWANSSYANYGALLFYKHAYLGVQNTMSSTTTDEALESVKRMDPKQFAALWRPTMRLNTWLGTGTKAFMFYSQSVLCYFYGAGSVLVFLAINNILFMMVFVIVWRRVRQM